jgi:mannose-6-phosphate isomerase-like protein (cupin superfamily)
MQPSVWDLDRLHQGVAERWKSIDVGNVNGNAVRCRVMHDVTADWHVHEDSDELFYVITGAVGLDTEHGTYPLSAGQLLVVPAGTRHRISVDGRATLLVVDNIR